MKNTHGYPLVAEIAPGELFDPMRLERTFFQTRANVVADIRPRPGNLAGGELKAARTPLKFYQNSGGPTLLRHCYCGVLKEEVSCRGTFWEGHTPL